MDEFFELFGVLSAVVAAGGIGYFVVGFIYITLRKMQLRANLPTETDTEQQTKELEGRIEVLESQVSRMAELEERVDFAERLLAKQREGARLPPAQG